MTMAAAEPMAIWLVENPRNPDGNVLITAVDEDMATKMCMTVLGGVPLEYIITQITKPGTRTIMLLAVEVTEAR